ncbi:hypothetical protein MJO29_014145 [Puccinia striiformis f. sp. tritici]|nr:hypothetical protein MJO29_014145 [Puccinia striiformis f. sp. tritici]
MKLIKTTFLLCLFGFSTFVMSHNCGGTTAWRGCSRDLDAMSHFCDSFFPLQLAPGVDHTHSCFSYIPAATSHCGAKDVLWCCPQNEFTVSQIPFRSCLLHIGAPYHVYQAVNGRCHTVKRRDGVTLNGSILTGVKPLHTIFLTFTICDSEQRTMIL